jgi:hypothetical protein
MTQDISKSALSLGRALDRLPANKSYSIQLKKVNGNVDWSVVISEIKVIQRLPKSEPRIIEVEITENPIQIRG